MALTKEESAVIISKFGSNEADTGNVKVQVALLTERIKQLTAHVQQFQTVFSAQKKGMQVFPPDGEYKVSVKMVISGSEEISVTKPAICKLESGLLRVLVSDGSCGAFVRSIQFC